MNIRPLAWLIAATVAAACSGAPRTAEPATRIAAQPQPAPSGAAAAPATVVDPSLVKAGNSVLKRHDQIYYCRNEIITGQRIGSQVCLTAAQIQDEKHEVTKAKEIMNNGSFRCLGGACAD